MRRAQLFLALVAVVCSLTALAGQAKAHEGPGTARATQVASLFAQQPVTISCEPTGDAWGWVFLYDSVIHLDPLLCDRLIDIEAGRYDGPQWEYGLAVLVLTHESYHLRKNWSARGNEAQTECKAIRHVVVSARLLGVPEFFIPWIKLGALFAHWNLTTWAPEYHLESCKVPKP